MIKTRIISRYSIVIYSPSQESLEIRQSRIDSRMSLYYVTCRYGKLIRITAALAVGELDQRVIYDKYRVNVVRENDRACSRITSFRSARCQTDISPDTERFCLSVNSRSRLRFPRALCPEDAIVSYDKSRDRSYVRRASRGYAVFCD